jgi:predicted secreted hydrolase
MTKRVGLVLCLITIVASSLACGSACSREEAATAEFELSNLAISPSELKIGEAITVTVDVENVGEVAGTKTLTLKIDGVEVETRDVTVEGGKTETVSFTLVPDAEGTYSIEIDGLSGSVTVKAPAAEGTVFEDRNANKQRDADEPGLANILVSNGITLTVTDEAGNYHLPMEGYFVSITTPGDYIATTPWYQSIAEEELNFGLAPAPKERDEFTFVQMTDVHLDTVSEHRALFEQAIEEIKEIVPDFVIVTGDLVNGADGATISQAQQWFGAYEESLSICELEMPVYHALGNHDVVGIHCEGVSENEPGYNEEMFRNYFGPTYYSFDWGLYHCVVLDPNELADGNQVYRIPDYELEWLQQDLAHREGKPLLVFFHEPTTSWQNRTEVLDLLKEHQGTMFSGHWHFDVLMDSQGISEQVTGALCGEWWYGSCPDGSPQGYRIIQVGSEGISSFYKGVGADRQINITAPGAIASGETTLIAQIYTEHGAIQEVSYQVDGGEPVTMQVDEGELWDIATALWDTTQVVPGYHTITIEARDEEESFSKEIELKVTEEETVPISELVSHFDAYQGQYTNIQGEVRFAVIGMLGAPEGTGAIIMRDETGGMVIIAGECISPPLLSLAIGDLITVKAMPIKLSWEFVQASAEFSMIEPYVGWLPEGLLEKDGNGNIKAIKVMRVLSGEDIQIVQPYGPRQVYFPEDEGAHPQFSVEWWYLNSTLMDSEGREYTAMVAYFRPTLKILSICDLEAEVLYQEVPSFQEILSASPDYAEGYLDLRWDDSDWWYRTDPDSFSYHLKAKDTDIGLNLDLVSEKLPLLVGGDGLIEWTEGSTYYYSLTRLQVEGEIELAGKAIDVSGIGWIDHQWMESMAERGWNWFSVQLDNDTEIIFWQIVNPDGSIHSRDLTMIFPDGSVYHTVDLELEMMESWVSPETGNEYGILWRVREETHDLDLEISARYAEQEIRVLEDFEPMELDFWEGGTTVSGQLDGEPVSGVGYAELVPPPQ